MTAVIFNSDATGLEEISTFVYFVLFADWKSLKMKAYLPKEKCEDLAMLGRLLHEK